MYAGIEIPTLGSNVSDPYGSLYRYSMLFPQHTEGIINSYIFCSLIYIYVSFNVNFLLLHSFGKTDFSAALTKQLLTE